MKLIIDISKDRYDEIMAMDWVNGRLFFDEELRAIHDGIPQMAERWIPVSERLPEEDGEYLATIYDMDENYEYIDIAELGDGKWCYKPYILVKAWMPLPKPYKAESEDKE